jgi:hypothetical protein
LKKKTKREMENIIIGLSMLIDPSKVADPRVLAKFAKEPEILMALWGLHGEAVDGRVGEEALLRDGATALGA